MNKKLCNATLVFIFRDGSEVETKAKFDLANLDRSLTDIEEIDLGDADPSRYALRIDVPGLNEMLEVEVIKGGSEYFIHEDDLVNVPVHLLDPDDLKQVSKDIARRVNELGFLKDGKPMGLTQAMEVAAAVMGFRNRHAMKAAQSEPAQDVTSQDEGDPGDRFTEILQHRIKWWLRYDGEGVEVPTELDECSIEHIEKLIKEGYVEGELCVTKYVSDDEDPAEFWGWWQISK